MIASNLSGRLRLRAPALREPGALDELAGRLAALPGAPLAVLNPRVGSLLVTYEPATLSERALLDALGIAAEPSDTGGAEPTRRRSRRVRQRTLELGIVGSLGVSVGAAVVGLKSLHIATGVAFLALAGVHIHRAGGIARWRRTRRKGT